MPAYGRNTLQMLGYIFIITIELNKIETSSAGSPKWWWSPKSTTFTNTPLFFPHLTIWDTLMTLLTAGVIRKSVPMGITWAEGRWFKRGRCQKKFAHSSSLGDRNKLWGENFWFSEVTCIRHQGTYLAFLTNRWRTLHTFITHQNGDQQWRTGFWKTTRSYEASWPETRHSKCQRSGIHGEDVKGSYGKLIYAY